MVVVMATEGYPGPYQKGSKIKDISKADIVRDVTVFHAATKAVGNQIYADGGRVLGITALGFSVREAQSKVYEAVDKINWPEGFCRRDIGWRAIARENT